MILKDCLGRHANEQPFPPAEEVFQMEKGQKSVENFIKASMEKISGVAERRNRGKTVDFGSASDLVRDITVLLRSVIPELGSQAERLEEVLLDMEWLKTRANDVILCSGSKYNLAENVETIFRLDNEIHNVLLQEFADVDDPYIVCSGKKELCYALSYTVEIKDRPTGL